jgi:hypothetical protein
MMSDDELNEMLNNLQTTLNKIYDLDPIATSEEEPLVNHTFKIEVKYAKKCECGAEKCGFPKHSDYCPKYTV